MSQGGVPTQNTASGVATQPDPAYATPLRLAQSGGVGRAHRGRACTQTESREGS
jgi:hypothetical protein